ncbi:hypothetical protein Tco_0066979 [Tanacetum coccineum]
MALMTPFQRFFNSKWPIYTTFKTRDDFRKYTGKDNQLFKDTMICDIDIIKNSGTESENNSSETAFSKSVNERQMQMQEGKVNIGKAFDAGLVVIERSGTKSGKQDTNNRSRNDADAYNANIIPKEPMAEVQLAAECNVFALGQQHAEQPEFNNKGRVNQDAEQCQTYKDLYDSIKKTLVQTEDHNDSLIVQLNKKSVENADLKAQIQEKVFANATLKNELRKKYNNQTSRNWPASKSSDATLKVVQKAYHFRNSSSFSDSKNFVFSTCQKCVFNADHDACVTNFLRDVNSRAKFSVVHEKTNTPTSCLRWKPMGRIFKTIGLIWVPTGKLFASSITKVDSEPPHGSNPDISNPHECIQTLDISACTLNLDAGLVPNSVSSTPYVPPCKKDWDILFQPMFDEYFNPSPSVVSPHPPTVVPIPADTTGTPSSTIIDQDAPSTSNSPTIEETQAPVIQQEPTSEESSSKDVIPSNLHQINQPFDHLRKWTKDHPLENVIGKPS